MKRRNGASWQAATFHRLYDDRGSTARDALREMTVRYRELMHSNEPVHTWPVGVTRSARLRCRAMRLMLMLAALAGLLLAVPTTASASKRYRGCVAESRGCQHKFVGGDLPVVSSRTSRSRRHGQHRSVPAICVPRHGVHANCARARARRAGRMASGTAAGTWNYRRPSGKSTSSAGT